MVLCLICWLVDRRGRPLELKCCGLSYRSCGSSVVGAVIVYTKHYGEPPSERSKQLGPSTVLE